MTYARTKHHVPISDGPVLMANIPKIKYSFREISYIEVFLLKCCVPFLSPRVKVWGDGGVGVAVNILKKAVAGGR
jgi:hypothetical protein